MSLFLTSHETFQAKSKKLTKDTRPKDRVVKGDKKLETLREEPKCLTDRGTVKRFLGKLYDDIEYLEELLKLMKDKRYVDYNYDTQRCIHNRVCDGLEFLYSRAEYWQQQEPVNMPSRRWDQDRRLEAIKRHKTKLLINTLVETLEDIDKAFTAGQYEESLENAQKTLDFVKDLSDRGIPRQAELTANLHNRIGNAYLELGNTEQAMAHHRLELQIAREHGLKSAQARTLDNLGRAHAKNGEFEKALEIWQQKIPLTRSSLENTWLFHEIGWCCFELQKYSDARVYGETSLQSAIEAGDLGWQLHATVLIAQSEAHLGDNKSASDTFKRALGIAKQQNDSQAVEAIQQALKEICQIEHEKVEEANNKLEQIIKEGIGSEDVKENDSCKDDKIKDTDEKNKKLESDKDYTDVISTTDDVTIGNISQVTSYNTERQRFSNKGKI